VLNGANRVVPRPGEAALILGAGPIGCLFVAVFRTAGVGPIVVVEPSAVRGQVALEVGADAVLGPSELGERRREILPDGADVVVDAVGTEFASAVDHATVGGRILLFGQNATARPPIHQYTLTEKALSVCGSYVTNFTFPTAIRLIERGELNVSPIVTHEFPLDRLPEAIDLLNGAATKVIMRPQS
jgi:threonine dehydrogenase-like Zn-dependent dehydrogenase